MSVSKYKFVSPGVFVNEIDNSRLPAATPARGPVIVGRTGRGPGMRPVSVNSFSEYIEIFGNPVPGGQGGDVWRNGNYTSPMYATYAAQAWLRNGQTATVIRLLGAEHTDATTAGQAGWGGYTRTTAGGGSYGLFLIDSGSKNSHELTGTLAAVWYFPTANGGIKLSGTIRGGASNDHRETTSGSAVMIESNAASYGFNALICSGTSGRDKSVNFNFDPDSDGYIRKVFNTNPILTNTGVTAAGNQEKYWLGESFERSINDTVSGSAAGSAYGFILGMGNAGTDWTGDWSGRQAGATEAQSGWIISQDLRGSTTLGFNPMSTAYITKLFRFKSRDAGDWANGNIKISIANIKAPQNADVDAFGTFDVILRDAKDTDNNVRVLEQFSNCNLNPNSLNYIARKIGNIYTSWDDDERRFRQYGDYPNISKLIWVDVNNEVAQGSTDPSLLPFGFHGPERPSQFWIADSAAATATITALSKTAGQANTRVLTIVDVESNSVSFTIDNSTDTSTATVIGFSNANSNAAQFATNIASAINAADTADTLNASATSDGAVVTLTMLTEGLDGNSVTDIAGTAVSDSVVTMTNQWNGGKDIKFVSTYSTMTAGATFATSSAAADAAGETGIRMTGSAAAHSSGGFFAGSVAAASSSYIYPAIALRVSSSDAGLPNPRAAYFGYDSRMAGSDRYDPSNNDILRPLPNAVAISDSTSNVEVSVAFTLDDIKVDELNSDGKLGKGTYVSGSRLAGNSATANTGSYTCILDDHGFNKFTVPMWGGSDGFDVTEADPLANRNIGSSETVSYEYNTWRRALDASTDPEQVDFNLLVAPGLTNESLTDLMVTVCEERGDSMAIIDLPSVYNPQHEGSSYGTFSDRVSTKLATTVTTFKTRKKNSSYGCTYYPWVQVIDSLNSATVWLPPSVVALGTFAHSDRVGELWFAPAGFNRGGLTQGSSGLTVTNITERLTSENRDDLYAANINPIASFPNEGIVIFGQKTMDATTSALSRINVRRLLIFLKKEISRLANQVLFDNNVPATWGRFKALVNPVLESVKVRFGLSDYRLVLDETTTTPDLIDRNIMYAKIFLKPARAIEFIALDFVITRTGASFDD